MVFPHILDVEPSGTGGGNSGISVDKMRSFCHAINYHHNTVLAVCFRQFGYEVHTNDVPRRIRNWQRMEFSYWLLAEWLCAETHVASGSVFADIPGHLGPPIITRD